MATIWPSFLTSDHGYVTSEWWKDSVPSSIGDGVTSAFSKLRPIWISHLHYFFPKMGKLKWPKKNGHHWHLLSRGCSSFLKLCSNRFCAHILRLHFKFTYSVAFSENHGSVTFSEIDDVIEQGFFPSKQGLSRVMSHTIVA